MSDQPGSPQPPRPEGRPSIDPSYSAPLPPPPMGYPPPYFASPAKPATSIISKMMTSLIATIFISSIVLNVYFAFIISQQVALGPVVEQTYRAGETDKRIVILPINGVIDDNAAEFVRNAIKRLNDNPPAAIVLRVNSGGGGVGASDRIWHELDAFRKQHPNIKIVASFGSYAASGGYYVSTLSDHIIAETTCITGSIGVMGQLFTVGGLLEKVGVEPVTMVATNSPRKDIANDITRTWTDQDRQVVQALLDNAYERFLQVVVEGRSGMLKEEEVRAIADGRVLTAQQAFDAKLVDEIGYLDDAVTKAAEMVNLLPDKVNVTILGSKPTLMQAIMGVDSDLPTLSAEQVRSAMTEMGVPQLSYTMIVR